MKSPAHATARKMIETIRCASQHPETMTDEELLAMHRIGPKVLASIREILAQEEQSKRPKMAILKPPQRATWLSRFIDYFGISRVL